MGHTPHSIGSAFEVVFLALQGFVVAFLLFHDWVPLGRLNNLGAIQTEDSFGRRVFVTLLPSVPAAIGLYGCAVRFGRVYPDWLEWLLWITYTLFLLGMLQAWWIPYLLAPDAKRAARYKILFRDTHRFLPERNGIAPDTLHCSLHLATVATVVGLLLRDRILDLI